MREGNLFCKLYNFADSVKCYYSEKLNFPRNLHLKIKRSRNFRDREGVGVAEKHKI